MLLIFSSQSQREDAVSSKKNLGFLRPITYKHFEIKKQKGEVLELVKGIGEP